MITENPIDALFQKQGLVKEQPTDQAPAPEQIGPAAPVQLLQLFGDYGVPFKIGAVKKSRRVQLLLYPEIQQRAAKTAAAIGISLNDLAAAALVKICDDYEREVKKNGNNSN